MVFVLKRTCTCGSGRSITTASFRISSAWCLWWGSVCSVLLGPRSWRRLVISPMVVGRVLFKLGDNACVVCPFVTHAMDVLSNFPRNVSSVPRDLSTTHCHGRIFCFTFDHSLLPTLTPWTAMASALSCTAPTLNHY